MDLDQSITVTALKMDGIRYNMLIGWQAKSFELFLYSKDKIWIGTFSANRLTEFSRKLSLSENTYFDKVKRCLTEQRDDYVYDLLNGLFYWKTMDESGGVIIEGLVPVELDTMPRSTRPDLLEVLFAINKQLKYKIEQVKIAFNSIKTEYEMCLKDAENFLNLKADMERSISDKFLETLRAKTTLTLTEENIDDHLVNVQWLSRAGTSDTSILSVLNIVNSATNKLYDNELLQLVTQQSDDFLSNNYTQNMYSE